MAPSEEQLDRGKKKRTVLRTATTKLLTKLDREIQSPEPDLAMIEELLAQLTEKEASLNALDQEIEDGIQDLEALEAEVLSREDYKERIISGRTRANRHLRIASGITVSTVEIEARTPSDIPANGVNVAAQVKLPRLAIEKFNGDACSWQGFWAQYSSAIHDNKSLAEIEKFNYLKSYMEGQAERAIAGLPLTAENYRKAVEILTSRFGRKDILINAHMNKLLSLNPVKKASDVCALRKLYDNCEVQIRSLESMGMVSDAYGGLLCPLLFKVIPDELALAFNRQRKEGEELTVVNLLAFIRKEVESLESTHLLTKGEEVDRNINSSALERQKQKSSQQSKDFRNPKWATAATLNVTVDDDCIFCENATHKTDECKTVPIDKKKELLRERGRCYICLKKRHLARNCRAKIVCPICNKRHRKALCYKAHSEAEPLKETLVASLIPDPNNQRPTVLLQTVRAKAIGPALQGEIRCLLDGGSQRTFIHEGMSRKLQLPVVGEEILKIYTFGKDSATNVKRRRVKLTLCNKIGNESIEIEALETPQISATIIQFPNDEIKKYTDSLGIQLSDTSGEQEKDGILTLLIGSDYYWRIVSGKFKRLSTSVVLMETLFGWSVQGPIRTSGQEAEESIGSMKIAVCNTEPKECDASAQLARFWELEAIGITDQQEGRSVSDDEAFRQFKSTVQYKDGRYQVHLPWKVEGVSLPSGYELAKRRLETLVKRLRKDPSLYEEYREIIEDHIKGGIAEVVHEPLAHEAENKPVFYLPHQAVVKREKSTSKVRIVFDASAHEPRAPSLNALLHPGPNLNPDLLNILISFRINQVAFVADIEKAFLQISLRKEDRDAVRFLWIEKIPKTENEPLKIKILRMTRVLFGVTSSPFLLAAVVRHHLSRYEEESPKVCKVLDESLYVDDLIDGATDEEEAFQVTNEAKQIMQAAGMSLRKWRSNSSKLQKMWENADFDTSSTATQLGDISPSMKVLGLIWNTQADTLHFDLSHLLEFLVHCKGTKRSILQAVGRIFDPVGFLTPFTIKVKILFQELWARSLQWDDELPPELKSEWTRWCEELPLLDQLSIVRPYFSNTEDSKLQEVQLHCFVDASEKAYGTVIYLRYVTCENEIETALLVSKSRVAPLKKLSVPRLELMGALLGVRLVKHVQRALRRIGTIKNYFWTDSVIALCWIKSTSGNWKPFVGNRVQEIQESTNREDWQHCPGTENPADLITRGQELSKFIEEKKWWKGPKWLVEDATQWPKLDPNKICQTSEEQQREKRILVSMLSEEPPREPIFEVSKFSSLTRILRATAWALRFITNSRQPKVRKTGPLGPEELSSAERYWIKEVQTRGFGDEIKSLNSRDVLPKSSRIAGTNPFLDRDGLLRLGGRLQYSNLLYEEKHPLLIPDKSEFATLLIRDSHEKVAHGGIAATLTQLRGRFWIIRARQLTKSVLSRCFICKRYRVMAATEITAPYPDNRIQRSPPFDVTGVDFAGPVYVKGTKGSDKAYIALYTCAVTRAIHLELVTNLTTEAFILSFKRFIARRGICKIIYSDNAKTFKAADKELQGLWNGLKKSELKEFFGTQGITWRFIVEHAAWWGGFWERMVRTVKTALKKILGKASLNFEELTTILVQVEAIINSRPLTYTYDGTEEPNPLTPAHFLIGNRLTVVPDSRYERTNLATATAQQLRARQKFRQRLLDHFWERWRSEYLLELRSAHFQPRPKKGAPIKEGEVVLLSERHIPRQMWKIGRVHEIHSGRDGKVRACTLRIPGNKLIRRPIQLLFPLELQPTEFEDVPLAAGPEYVAESLTTARFAGVPFSEHVRKHRNGAEQSDRRHLVAATPSLPRRLTPTELEQTVEQ